MTPVPGSAREWIAGVLALVIIAGLAFSAGRFSAPLQVETRDVERVVYRDRVVTVKAKAETKVIYRDRTVTPDGAVRDLTTTRTDTREGSASTGDHASETERKAETKTTLRPDWRVGAKAGASLVTPALTLSGPVVVGVEVERRIAGGVSAGVWVNSVGAAGVGISMEF